jgi:hypothetical protein
MSVGPNPWTGEIFISGIWIWYVRTLKILCLRRTGPLDRTAGMLLFSKKGD